MPLNFSSLVVFAEMRTGSNFLESNLNAFPGITCHGEAFNPHFIGYPNKSAILGVDQETRDNNPEILLEAIRTRSDGLGGFRYFHDHDPRVVDLLIDDPSCAKIILTRNPVESYVSWKIAQATGQWKLTDMKAHKSGRALFDENEFSSHIEALQKFQLMLLRRLQTQGQTAFYIAYEDLQSVEVMNGLARFLGVDDRLETLDKSLKKQNPEPVAAKVSNFDEMQAALSRFDQFDLTRTPNFEPRRGPVVPSYVASAKAPLLYLPLRSGPEPQILDWLSALDNGARSDLLGKMNQKELRQWKRKNPGHRSFTVLRHPVDRAHDAFCRHIVTTGKGTYSQLRATLIKRYKLPLPDGEPDNSYDEAAHRAAFKVFLAFIKGNLNGQTAIRVDQAWCTQAQAIQGFGEFALPDRIIRENDLETELQALAYSAGLASSPALPPRQPQKPFDLGAIYDDEIEKLAADAYQRDYMMFGFDRWQ